MSRLSRGESAELLDCVFRIVRPIVADRYRELLPKPIISRRKPRKYFYLEFFEIPLVRWFYSVWNVEYFLRDADHYSRDQNRFFFGSMDGLHYLAQIRIAGAAIPMRCDDRFVLDADSDLFEVGEVLVVVSRAAYEKVEFSLVFPRNRYVKPVPYNVVFEINAKRLTSIREIFQDAETEHV
jgi:hypothetical protein